MKLLSEYPKPKKGVQNNYAKEISQKTGTREDAVNRWLTSNEIDPVTILQGIGSGRINRMDFVSALMSDEATLEFLQQYNSDGKWKSVWGAKSTAESLSEMVRRIIKEEVPTYQFDRKEYNKLIEDSLDGLYLALNNIEDLIPNYLKQTKQGKLIDTFHTKVNLTNLRKTIDTLETILSTGKPV